MSLRIIKIFFSLAMLPLLVTISCAKKPPTVVEEESTIEPPVEPTYTDVKKLVTVGAGINFNGSTGSWSEMAINPVTKAPEIVYYDRTAVVSPIAGALKFAAITASGNWNVEVVDTNSPITAITNTCGGGATTAYCIGAPNVAVPTASQDQIYDVKHLLSGGVATPVIAYAYGTGGASSSISGKSVRFAVRNANGTWAVETAVTGAQLVTATTGSVGPQLATLQYPIKAVRILVDDSNRVHLTFVVYAATANNSVYLYSMRSSAGVWSTPAVISTTLPSTLAVVSSSPTYGASTGVTQAGAAWCKYNSGGTSADATGILISSAVVDNSPAASTQGFLLKCATANADGSCATWQGLDFVAGCSGACVTTTPATAAGTINHFNRSDIAVDPVTGKIFLSYFSAAPTYTAPAAIATGILSTQSPAACSAGLTSTAWSTVRAYPTAAQGTLGFRVASDGTNHYLASLTAATGTSLVVNKLSSILAANWNTAPDQVTVETSTNTIGGGFAYETSTGVLWGSYGAFTAAVAGATGQDIKAFSAYSGDINATTGTINNWYVDQTNFVSQVAAVPMLDAAIAPNGNVGYVYFYQEPGTAGPNSKLYYGIRGGSASSPVFGEKIVSNSIAGATTFMNGLHPSLDFDSESNPVISFLDQGVAASTGYLMIARSNNGGVSFSLDRVDGSTVTTKNVGQYSSVDMSTSDTVGVSYYDYSTGATGQRLKFAKRQKSGAWLRYVVDGPGTSGTGCDTTASATIGLYSQFKWTSTGRPVILYQGAVSGVKTLKLAYATEDESSATYAWKCLTIDTGSQGANTRGEGIDFVLDSSDKPYIAHYDSGVGSLRVVTCPDYSGVLTCAAAGSSAFVGDRLSYVIGTVNSIASKPGIRVDTNGKIWVSFHASSDRGLFVSYKEANGSWATIPEAIEATTGSIGSSYTGHHGTLLLNSSKKPMVFFRGFENWIKYFSREQNE